MIAYAIVILTDLAEVNTADSIEMKWGLDEFSFGGNIVRGFIKSTKKILACPISTNSEEEVLELIMKGIVPPPFREIFEMLYYELKEVIV